MRLAERQAVSYHVPMGAAELASYYVTPEQYLADELLRDQRHEYVDGIVYPVGGVTGMAGASHAHTRITGNINALLLHQLRGHRCEPFSTDTKIGIRQGKAQFYYYPDVVVDCGGGPDDAYFATEPRVIFEVLSRETERVDRLEKRDHYQALSSLTAYVLVGQYHPAVTVYHRQDDGWTAELLTGAEEVLTLPAIDCSLPLTMIYARTQVLR